MEITAVSLSYLPIAVGLGALHALEPGHAKTMTAAYLVGIHGRWTDAVLLGLAAALTHSMVVIGIAVTALYVGREAFAGDAIWWLQIGSGVVVILLGSWMLWRRLRPQARVPHHHEAAAPVVATGPQHRCEVSITGEFPNERMILLFATAPSGAVSAAITRPGGKTERLTFAADAAQPLRFVSAETPQEPHEFSAVIELADGERLPFAVTEPEGHGHDHLDDVAHAKAHADQMPTYVGTGMRPTWWQVVAFGGCRRPGALPGVDQRHAPGPLGRQHGERPRPGLRVQPGVGVGTGRRRPGSGRRHAPPRQERTVLVPVALCSGDLSRRGGPVGPGGGGAGPDWTRASSRWLIRPRDRMPAIVGLDAA